MRVFSKPHLPLQPTVTELSSAIPRSSVCTLVQIVVGGVDRVASCIDVRTQVFEMLIRSLMVASEKACGRNRFQKVPTKSTKSYHT